MINELKESFDYILCDSPAGIEKGALMALYFADSAVIVTNPEVSSVRDSDRILGILGSKSKRAIEGLAPIKEHLLVTRYSEARVRQGDMLSLSDIQEILSIPLLGVIPESPDVLSASNAGVPITLFDDSEAGAAYRQAIAALIGKENVPDSFIKKPKRSILKRILGIREEAPL